MSPETLITRLREAMSACGVSELNYRDGQTSCRIVITSTRTAEARVVTSPEAGHVRLAHPLRTQRPATGEAVPAGAPLLFIESDARLFPVTSSTAGRISQWLAKEGQRVDYGASLLLIETL